LIYQGVPSPSEYDWTPHITLKLNNNFSITIPYEIHLTGFELY
jgi:hypothetical protein